MIDQTINLDGKDYRLRIDPVPLTDPPVTPPPIDQPDGATTYLYWSLLQTKELDWKGVNHYLTNRPVTLILETPARLGTYPQIELWRRVDSPHLLTIRSEVTNPASAVESFTAQNAEHRPIDNILIERVEILPRGRQKAIAFAGNNCKASRFTARHVGGATEAGPLIYVVPTADAAHGGSAHYATPSRNIVFEDFRLYDCYGESIYIGGGGSGGNGGPHSGITIRKGFIRNSGEYGGQPDAIDIKRVNDVLIEDIEIEDVDFKGEGRAIVTQGVNLLTIRDINIKECRNPADGLVVVSDTWGVASQVDISEINVEHLSGTPRSGVVHVYNAEEPAVVMGITFDQNHPLATGKVEFEGQTPPVTDPPVDPPIAPPVEPPVDPPVSTDGVRIEVGPNVRSALWTSLMSPSATTGMRPGDVIVIRESGANFPNGIVVDHLKGSKEAPIAICSESVWSGKLGSDSARTGGRLGAPVLLVGSSCHNVDFVGFDFWGTSGNRIDSNGVFPELPAYGTNVYGQSIQFIACRFRDCLSGFGHAGSAAGGDTTALGCVFMNNGGMGGEGGRTDPSGHGFYGQNNTVQRPLVLRGCLIAQGFDLCGQFYGSSHSRLLGFTAEQCVFWGSKVIIGGTGSPCDGVRLISNLFYHCHLNLGHSYGMQASQVRNGKATVIGNHFVGHPNHRGAEVVMRSWDELEFHGNYITHPGKTAIELFRRSNGEPGVRQLNAQANMINGRVHYNGNTSDGEPRIYFVPAEGSGVEYRVEVPLGYGLRAVMALSDRDLQIAGDPPRMNLWDAPGIGRKRPPYILPEQIQSIEAMNGGISHFTNRPTGLQCFIVRA